MPGAGRISPLLNRTKKGGLCLPNVVARRKGGRALDFSGNVLKKFPFDKEMGGGEGGDERPLRQSLPMERGKKKRGE